MKDEEIINLPDEQKKPDTGTSKTDNLADDTDNRKTGKKNMFVKKESREKVEKQELKTQVEQLIQEKAELNDKFLRLFSEFDNYRKRVNQEKLALVNTASEKVIVNLLPVIDDFERAIAANEKSDDLNAIKNGFNLIYNKLLQLLKHFGVQEIEAKGTVFNTDYHEAVTHIPADKEEDRGKVVDVTEKGYILKDKVIRFSKVVVTQ